MFLDVLFKNINDEKNKVIQDNTELYFPYSVYSAGEAIYR